MAPAVIRYLFQAMITLGYLLSPLIMLKMNRKPQLVASSMVMAIGLALVGCRTLIPTHSQRVAPLIGVFMAGLSYGTGVGSVPFALITEIFPQRMKSTGLALALSDRAVFIFSILKAYPSLRSVARMNDIFLAHSFILMVSVVFTLVFVPETRDKSVSQLEYIFRKEQNKDQDRSVEQLAEFTAVTKASMPKVINY